MPVRIAGKDIAAGGTTAKFGERMAREIALWHKIVRQAGMAVD